METIDFLDREIDVYYDYKYAEPSVGLNERISIWKITYMGRSIMKLLSQDSIDTITEKVWDEIDKSH